MPGDAVIVIPTQGTDTNSFESVARTIKQRVYSQATIVKTTVTGSNGSFAVSFSTLDGHAFSWDTAHNLSRVLTVSHAFSLDGPNLAYHDPDPSLEDPSGSDRGHQPWGADRANLPDLSAAGKAFWESVGRSLRADGKIILLGCFMGGALMRETSPE
jgi:hypothetical protein